MSAHRVALLLSGPSGAGKSTWAGKYASSCDHPVCVCSADDYFYKNTGSYVFVPEELEEAHNQCLRKFINALNEDNVPEVPTIIVDNTNTTLVELAPYIRIAEAFGYGVLVHAFLSRYRGVHGVPDAKVEQVAVRHRDMLYANTTWRPDYSPTQSTLRGFRVPVIFHYADKYTV